MPVTRTPRKTRFRMLAKLYRAGLVTRRVPMKGFRYITSPFPKLSWRTHSSTLQESGRYPDLALLGEVAASYRHHRRQCLLHLEAGRPIAAFPHARRCQRLHPDAESRRLQALCALLIGDWITATNLARHWLMLEEIKK